MGHVMNVDHFHMSDPTFPPHPHAGFSAVTWMLPWSEGGFVNRDSLGDRSRITPGSLHWTMAGAGMLHEEIPEHPGTDCEGLQIFVKLPEPLEDTEGRAFHVDAADIPVVALGGGRASVLVGELAGAASPVPSHAKTTMFHLELDGQFAIEVPSGVDAFVVVLRGDAEIDGRSVSSAHAVALSAGSLATLKGQAASALLAWSEPMPARPTFAGPFCMFDRGRLLDAQRRYSSGRMGSLSRSSVRWSR